MQTVLRSMREKDLARHREQALREVLALRFFLDLGKVPVGVAKAGRKNGCKVIALAGSVTDDAVACNKEGIDAFFPIIRGATTLNEAMDIKNAQKNMKNTAEQVFRLIDISSLME